MSDFRPEVLDALAAAGYPRPTLDESVALGIFRIDPAYVRGLAGAGYRLGSIGDLVAFKIHKVTPDYIASFARIGHRNLPADKLVAMRDLQRHARGCPRARRRLPAPSPSQRMRLRLAGRRAAEAAGVATDVRDAGRLAGRGGSGVRRSALAPASPRAHQVKFIGGLFHVFVA